ncbi:MAG: hypothetical protein KBT03_07520, partial [Bacteroidales bacterium]|nr:hypothetical protein [Candidatus Scybalousia scybalohippi]
IRPYIEQNLPFNFIKTITLTKCQTQKTDISPSQIDYYLTGITFYEVDSNANRVGAIEFTDEEEKNFQDGVSIARNETLDKKEEDVRIKKEEAYNKIYDKILKKLKKEGYDENVILEIINRDKEIQFSLSNRRKQNDGKNNSVTITKTDYVPTQRELEKRQKLIYEKEKDIPKTDLRNKQARKKLQVIRNKIIRDEEKKQWPELKKHIADAKSEAFRLIKQADRKLTLERRAKRVFVVPDFKVSNLPISKTQISSKVANFLIPPSNNDGGGNNGGKPPENISPYNNWNGTPFSKPFTYNIKLNFERKPSKKNPVTIISYETTAFETVERVNAKPSTNKQFIVRFAQGCLGAAIFFQNLVANTPIDEEYTYQITRYKRRNRDENGRIRYGKLTTGRGKDRTVVSSESIAKNVMEGGQVEEYKVNAKHVPDNEEVRGDWVLTFRGMNFKAYETDEPKWVNPSYNIGKINAYFRKSLFEKPNDIHSIMEIATILAKNTMQLNNSDVNKTDSTFEYINKNGRWALLEYGGYYEKDSEGNVKPSTSVPKQGAKHTHGTKNGFVYQAPRGMLRITELIWNGLLENRSLTYFQTLSQFIKKMGLYNYDISQADNPNGLDLTLNNAKSLSEKEMQSLVVPIRAKLRGHQAKSNPTQKFGLKKHRRRRQKK